MGQLKLTILGCGASGGVPAIGNNWGKCNPKEPKNNRTRASLAVQGEEGTLVIDTGPDFRFQLNREDIRNVDAILYTHAHGDHVAGIDELRSFHRRNKEKQPIPVYSNRATIKELQERFAYMFEDRSAGLYPKVLAPLIWSEEELYEEHIISGIPFIPFEQDHATCKTLGFRFGDIGYSTDMIDLDDRAISVLKGIKTWIADGAGYYYDPITVHASIPRLEELNARIGAEIVYTTHLSLTMDYEEMLERLPCSFYPCYDGLTFKTKI